jgi:hypothetical protein
MWAETEDLGSAQTASLALSEPVARHDDGAAERGSVPIQARDRVALVAARSFGSTPRLCWSRSRAINSQSGASMRVVVMPPSPRRAADARDGCPSDSPRSIRPPSAMARHPPRSPPGDRCRSACPGRDPDLGKRRRQLGCLGRRQGTALRLASRSLTPARRPTR